MARFRDADRAELLRADFPRLALFLADLRADFLLVFLAEDLRAAFLAPFFAAFLLDFLADFLEADFLAAFLRGRAVLGRAAGSL